jgi:hypothetical protein
MQADYPGAEAHFLPADHFGYPNNNGHVAIVIHKTGGDATPESVEQTFLDSGKSVHYVIGQDGRVWQFVLESGGAGGNCCTEPGYDPFWDQYLHKFSFDLNLCTISIEHCDPSLDNSTPLTPAQKDASFKLVAYLAKKYSIPASHIKTHASIDPINRARCPGNYPMDELLQFVQAGGPMGVPAGWRDDDTTLTAPNQKVVVKGFRQYVLDHNWDPANLPLENEHHLDQLEVSNPSLGGGSQQAFRWTVMEWTQKDNRVFEMWTGQELLGLRQQLGGLKQQVQSLQQQIASLKGQSA